MSVELATASYRTFIPAMGVPVATSLGRPKFPISYELTEEVGALKPFGLLDLDGAEFTARYRDRLEKVGTAKLWRVFHAISRKHDGARLVLLCYEDVLAGQFCHRRVFADWWQERAGQAVPELSWIAGQDGVPVVVREAEPATTRPEGAQGDLAGYAKPATSEQPAAQRTPPALQLQLPTTREEPCPA